MHDLSGRPVDYLERLLERTAHALRLPWRAVRSSSLPIQRELSGQDRILAIAGSLGATRYVNPPGGRSLYDAQCFSAAGITLGFLPEYTGSHASILARLLDEPSAAVADEI